jgi:hypothetical protein
MSEVSAEQRQRAKTAAANAAVAANDAAVVLGAAGAVVALAGVASGVGALAGVGMGAALAVCSFGAWFVGNRYQRLANDPPRSDFDQVTTSTARLLEETLPAQEPDATVARFASQHLILADALSALVDSLERFDGASGAGDTAAASAQADAAQQNAQTAIQALNALIELASTLNQAWDATLATVDWDSVSIGNAQQVFRDAIGDPAETPGGALQKVLASVGDLSGGFGDVDVSSHPLLTATEMPGEPQTLIDGGNAQLLGSLSDSLRDLVVVGNA